MTAARVEVLLPGRSLTTPEGSLGFCGSYLVTSPGESSTRIVFDPGHVGRRRALVARLAECGVGVDGVDAVVLSHAHWDHAQNADVFPRARVLVHSAELEDVEAPDHDLDVATPRWTAAMLRAVGATPVAEGQALAPGVDVIWLPGHTRGSIGLRVATSTGIAVLTGDAISRRDVAISRTCAIAHFGGEAARTSIARVLDRADHIWPGHDSPFAVENGEAGDYLWPSVEVTVTDRRRR